jgi:hypothetical protein
VLRHAALAVEEGLQPERRLTDTAFYERQPPGWRFGSRLRAQLLSFPTIIKQPCTTKALLSVLWTKGQFNSPDGSAAR